MRALFHPASSRRRPRGRAVLLLGSGLFVLSAGIGCGDFTLFGEDEDEDINRAPVADALADNLSAAACSRETLNLDGRGSSDPDGDSLTYQWAFTQRPEGSAAALQNATQSQASFQPDEPGSYVVQLTVEDEGGLSGTDSVTVTARSDPLPDAGEDQQVSFGETVSLDGGDSLNPEEGCTPNGLSFGWSLTDPGGGQSDLGANAEASFVAELEGTYTATLTVENESGIDSDTVQITAGESALDALQGGPYLFTVEEVTDTMFGGILEGLSFPQTTVDVPTTDEVPVTRTISLSVPPSVTVQIVVDVDRENALDDFYTLAGTASGRVSLGSLACQMTTAECTGRMTPESATSVGASLTISNPEVTPEACAAFVNEQGTVAVSLSGGLQTGE
jgi:PKD repeat protein